MKSFTKILAICGVLTLAPAQAITLTVDIGQIAVLSAEDVIEQVQDALEVVNSVTQIGQLDDLINISEETNSILGEYGLGDLTSIQETVDSLSDINEVEDLTSILDQATADFSVEELEAIFSDSALDFLGGSVEAPQNIDQAKYQQHVAYEKAFSAAQELQTSNNEQNVILSEEAKQAREDAVSATNQADYAAAIDKAEAAEAAIKRNQDATEIAMENAKLIRTLTENHEAKNSKAALDNAVAEELSVLEADLQDRIANPLRMN